jgi:hypothetical protein
VCIDDSDAFKLQHGRKANFFDCHRRFHPLSHEFRGDKESFQKGKSIRKGRPKRKLRADEITMRGYKALTFVKCTTVMIAVLVVKSGLESSFD